MLDNHNSFKKGSPFDSSLGSREQGAVATRVGASGTGGKSVLSSSTSQPQTTSESSNDAGARGPDDETMKDEYF